MSGAAGLPLAVTLGEPAGIGPDLTLAIWQRRREYGAPPFYVIGDVDFLAARARMLGLAVRVEATVPREACAVFPSALPVVPLPGKVTARPGAPDETSAAAAIGSIDAAVADVIAGRAGAVVTNPIAKSVLYRAGFTDPGHTEYLARLAERATGNPVMPVMMLWSPELAVVPVTIHVPVAPHGRAFRHRQTAPRGRRAQSSRRRRRYDRTRGH
jgi:4-hydroxythreonine-4-phosphate dehydrogenase